MNATRPSGEICPQGEPPAWFTPDHVAKLFSLAADSDNDVAFEAATARVKQRLSELSDDDAIAFLAKVYVRIDEVSYGLTCAARATEGDLERRLRERMAARGNETSEIAIPHPLVDVVLSPQFGPYQPDTDMLEVIAKDPALKDDERAKLVKITPEHVVPEQTIVVPARVVPREVRAGNVTSIVAIAKKYAGSTLARALDAAMPRQRLPDKFIIRRKKGT